MNITVNLLRRRLARIELRLIVTNNCTEPPCMSNMTVTLQLAWKCSTELFPDKYRVCRELEIAHCISLHSFSQEEFENSKSNFSFCKTTSSLQFTDDLLHLIRNQKNPRTTTVTFMEVLKTICSSNSRLPVSGQHQLQKCNSKSLWSSIDIH